MLKTYIQGQKEPVCFQGTSQFTKYKAKTKTKTYIIPHRKQFNLFHGHIFPNTE